MKRMVDKLFIRRLNELLPSLSTPRGTYSGEDILRALIGAVLFGGVNAIQFRLQAAGTTIPAAFLGMLPYLFTILVLVVITWWEAFSKRVGAPAALGLPYVREERG